MQVDIALKEIRRHPAPICEKYRKASLKKTTNTNRRRFTSPRQAVIFSRHIAPR
jgi:hypothetical protein